MKSRSLALLALLALAGCGARAHLTKTHGRSYRAAFERSVANPAARAQPPRGLDSQEAAIVSESFRRSLAPRDREAKEAPVLLVAPPAQGGQVRQLAPSVPHEGR